ncbi:polyhydroxyalkanoic acid system family protein [Woeseia oceani]|uniref:Polyhydroxyalkanoic acid system protein n=1 Tax=Woeseia oceani TaxID=1548547 RepID=A0A193LKU0_9GAMM|nr:polyhydroxyalkanoic acid system family protein [Woeseia oceani]ANO53061.1 hypothetical protein BA177_07095 [Woeseia oceani]
MRIEREHTLGRDEARKRVERLATSLKGQFDLESRWEGDQLRVSGRGLSGALSVGDDRVNLDLQLGLALSFMESSIRSAIESEMDKQLA